MGQLSRGGRPLWSGKLSGIAFAYKIRQETEVGLLVRLFIYASKDSVQSITKGYQPENSGASRAEQTLCSWAPNVLMRR